MTSSPKETTQTPAVATDPNLLGADAFKVVPPRNPAGQNTGEDQSAPRRATGSLWMKRILLVLYVALCIEVGMFLAVVPWTSLWTENNIALTYPFLRTLASGNFMRGFVTGIGLVNIWLGIWEAVHYREPDTH